MVLTTSFKSALEICADTNFKLFLFPAFHDGFIKNEISSSHPEIQDASCFKESCRITKTSAVHIFFQSLYVRCN